MISKTSVSTRMEFRIYENEEREYPMKYPINTQTIVDITKPPYCADNTGREDCTDIIRRALDDILIREIEAMTAIHDKLIRESYDCTENVYIGIEAGRVQNGKLWITFPEYLPPTRILYFPKGTYLVSDTVSYTHKNLKNFWYTLDYYEANRNIHIVGESREETVIRLKDNAPGYGSGKNKAVVSFVNHEAPVADNQEYANNAFFNCIEDITIDCGRGNPDAVGMRYISSNIGRIRNVDVRAEGSRYGIVIDYASQGALKDVTVSGFDYGIAPSYTVLVTLDDIDLSGNRMGGIFARRAKLISNNVYSGNLPTLTFREPVGGYDEPVDGRYYFTDDRVTFAGCKTERDFIFFDTSEEGRARRTFPKTFESYATADVAFVDDYGAVGDGVTDSSRAIQRAMDSGKPTVLFGEGMYLINKKIKIPATVKCVDFLYCSLASGIRLVGGEYDSVLEISEDADTPVVIKNLFAFEQLRGHFRLIKHACTRPAVIRDIQLMCASLYFNSVPGGHVWLENIFLTTGTYTDGAWIPGDGFDAVYSRILPYEFHGQTVYGHLLNPERADIAMLAADGSDVMMEGFRTEGSGTALRVTGDSFVDIRMMNVALGNKKNPRPIIRLESGTLTLRGFLSFGFDRASEYQNFLSDTGTADEKIVTFDELPHVGPHSVLIEEYTSK